MSSDSIRLIDKRAALRWNPCHSRNVARGLIRYVCRSLMADSRRRAEEATTDIGACLEPFTEGAEPHRAYNILKRWYQHTLARAPNPSRTDMEKVREDFQTFYQREEPLPPRTWPAPGNTRQTGQGEQRDTIRGGGGGRGTTPTPTQGRRTQPHPRGALQTVATRGIKRGTVEDPPHVGSVGYVW